MRTLHLAAASLNQTPLDWDGNEERIRVAIADAKKQHATLICLPELAITGYGCEDQFLAPDTADRALASLRNLIPLSDRIAFAVGLPLRYQNRLFNVVALVANGELVGFYAKQNLAGDGLHYEPRWFSPWPEGVQETVTLEGREVPLGDFVFQLDDVRIAFEICEDAWVPDRPGRDASSLGADLIINPSASHFAFGKQEIRRQFVCEGSRAFGVAYLYANLLGNEAGKIIYDGGNLIANNGTLIAEGTRFSFQDHALTGATVDLELNRLAQARSAGRPFLLESDEIFSHPFRLPESPHLPTPINLPDHLSKEEEFTRSVTLGLFDYLRKSYSRGYVISLSGGADSAACAVLVAQAIQLARTELGEASFRERLRHLGDQDEAFTMPALLACIYQSSENSGDTTLNAAQSLAKALGCTFDHWNIAPMVEEYEDMIERHLERPLSWEQDDIARQNIQARVRAPGIWMLANLRNALLITTSNRSEAAVGYATMDGDTCGGLAPIAGIDKAFLRHWLRWMETTGTTEIPPLPVLSAVNKQQPTAELRPDEAEQTDEGDLMPYPLLDQIEKWAIRDKRSPRDILALTLARFPDYQEKQVRVWVKRFFQLWSRNQWKRERYAPGFHLDDDNLDPKTWCRFPILSGGFQKELSEL
ncbi:NAD(+) synthase [Roseibacillus persicicus]|uniref:NAD(+) synthase n=1 Tax=Roseibacillus persicicus TaxID=454148 RepID=UPI00280EFE09|nr:NAD(+) synthase [Roseibacillus persicicus]MDQ8190373.1 NAD(+) synthase [Roseibacillus persicicus]